MKFRWGTSVLEHLNISSFDEHKPVFHHWKSDFTSRSFSFEGNLTNNKVTHHNINTSYWMPDRPDLQSVIAHEVAHGILHDRLAKLDFEMIDADKSDFVRLLKHMDFCIQFFEDEMPSEYPAPFEEIVVDLLAATIMGPAYLYAFLLEYIGFGLEELFTDADNYNRLNLNTVRFMVNSFAKKDQIFDWYYRIEIVCTWLKAVYPESSSDKELVRRLIEASRQIVKNLHHFIEKNTPEELNTAGYWIEFSDRLCKIIKQSKTCTNQVKQWLTMRDKDSDAKRGNHEFPRSCIGLPPLLRKKLVEGMWCKKAERTKKDQKNLVDYLCDRHFQKVYGFFPEKEFPANKAKKEFFNNEMPKILFRNLFDIPWQSAFLRGLDVMHEDSCLKPGFTTGSVIEQQQLFQEMHNSVTLGRELYQITLDFNLHNLEPTWQRLVEAIGLIDDYSSRLDESLLQKITKWLGESDKEEEQRDKDFQSLATSIFDLLRKETNDNSEWEQLARKYPARILAQAAQNKSMLSQNNHGGGYQNSSFHRRLGKLQGMKLQLLLELLRDLSSSPGVDKLSPLVNFLEIRESGQDVNKEEKVQECVLSALNIDSAMKYWNPPDLEQLSRICIAGVYQHSKNNDPSLRILNNSGSYNWFKEINYGSQKLGERFQTLVSRYDIIAIRKIRPIPRCYIGLTGSTEHTKSKGDKTCLPSYFVRRELAIPVRLGKKKWKPPGENQRTFAIIAITLKRPGSRLDFIYRLLQSIRANQEQYSTLAVMNPKQLHQLSELHLSDKYDDRAYLSDSWADILLFFGGFAEKRLLKIFQTQNVIFQDFQVDRTELILTPECFDVAARQPDKFSVGITIRLLEDRFLSGSNEGFIKKFMEKARKQNITMKIQNGKIKHQKKSKLSDIIDIYRVTGRMDFSLNFKKDENKIIFDPKLYEKTVDCLTDNRYVERLQTNIKLIEHLVSFSSYKKP